MIKIGEDWDGLQTSNLKMHGLKMAFLKIYELTIIFVDDNRYDKKITPQFPQISSCFSFFQEDPTYRISSDRKYIKAACHLFQYLNK